MVGEFTNNNTMKTFDIFIVKKDISTQSLPPSFSDGNIYNNINDIQTQAENNKISCSVQSLFINELPRNSQALMVVILDERSYIPSDYLIKIMALKTLHPKAAGFFGTRHARINGIYSETLAKYYNLMRSDNNNYISYSINGMPKYYPSIYGTVLSGDCYNTIGGYGPLALKNNKISDYNHFFLSAIDNYGSFIYHSSIDTTCMIPKETTNDFVYQQFYEYGSECRFKEKSLSIEKIRLGITNDDDLSWHLYNGWHESGMYFKK